MPLVAGACKYMLACQRLFLCDLDTRTQEISQTLDLHDGNSKDKDLGAKRFLFAGIC
jgi:hypothetical protein